MKASGAARLLESAGMAAEADQKLDAKTRLDDTSAPNASRSGAIPISDSFGSLPTMPLSLPEPTGAPTTGAAAGAEEEEEDDGDIVVKKLIASGGMGSVYLAEQRSLSRDVVVKTVPSPAKPAFARALISEGTITGRLEHPNIVPVHSLVTGEDGRPMLIMKYVGGVTWSRLLEDDRHEAWATVPFASDRLEAHLRILLQVAQAVGFANERGFVHRDIKPDNVMIGGDGEVYLLDWGIALDVREGPVSTRPLVGTPFFFAPEMAEGGALGSWTDVFQLGANLHVILVRKPRHHGTTLVEVVDAAIVSAPFDYDDRVPGELADLANRATSREPSARPASARDFAKGITEYLVHRSSIELVESAEQRLETFLAGLRESDESARVGVGRLATEAHFALREALRDWPENARAKELLRTCLGGLVDLEIARGNASAARSHLAELVEAGATDPEREAKITAIEAAAAASLRERDQLRQIAHDVDPTIAAQEQKRLAVVLLAVCLAVSVAAVAFRGEGAATRPVGTTYIMVAAGMAAAYAAGVVALRKRLFRNAASRRLIAAGFATWIVIIAHRVLAMLSHDSLVVAARTDYLVAAAATIAMGLLTSRAWLVLGTVFLLGSIAVQTFESQARLLANLVPPIAFGVMAFTSWLVTRNRAKD